MKETIKIGDYTVQIEYDECADSPREWENLATMVCNHRRYNLGDETLDIRFADTWEEAFAQHIAEEFDLHVCDWSDLTEKEFKQVWDWINKNLVWEVLSLHDHSGIHLLLGARSGWDCGRVGYIYTTKKKAVESWGNKYFTKKVLKSAEKWIEGEIEEYNDYLSGNVYMFTLTKGDEQLDSCGRFYGYDNEKNGLLPYVRYLIAHEER